MHIPLLPKDPIFPDPNLADAEGLIGLSTDLSTERILAAYNKGIFPWFEEQGLYFWFSPDPRMVLHAAELHVQKSMRPYLNQNKYTVTFDRAFKKVMQHCARTPRAGQESTWISADFIDAYYQIHRMGLAHSVEVWEGNDLVGGLYGLCLGGIFFGESMFSKKANASKFGFIKLVHWLQNHGIHFIDCQVYTDHLAQLGAREIPRTTFLNELKSRINQPSLIGAWHYSAD